MKWNLTTLGIVDDETILGNFIEKQTRFLEFEWGLFFEKFITSKLYAPISFKTSFGKWKVNMETGK